MSKEQSNKRLTLEEADKPLLVQFYKFKADNQIGDFCDTMERLAERRFHSLYRQGLVFATMEDLERTHVDIKPNEWDSLKDLVRRSEAPDFKRRRLNTDPRNLNPCEFVATVKGALDDSATVLPPLSVDGSKDNYSEVNNDLINDLIPVDIFGEKPVGTAMAHLLPKARGDAITWGYPACAVLGLRDKNGNPMIGKDTVFQKAVLGCKTEKTATTASIRYPGIRNMLSNLVRFSVQDDLYFFDKQPFLCIFPIYDLEEAKGWKGDAYEAILVGAFPQVAKKIGMTGVEIMDAKVANFDEINKAVGLASTLCKFLAHSVLQKNKEDVDKYQTTEQETKAHAKFREERKIEVPLTSPLKPFFKISFANHDAKEGHPAPDPMLLAFKSCKNWCQTFSGFQMVAANEPEDSDDGLSKEGKENLQAYIEWQMEQEKILRHDDITGKEWRLRQRQRQKM